MPPQTPANLTLFVNRVFADVVRLRWGHPGGGQAQIHPDWHPWKRRHRHREERAPEDGAETRAMQLQAKDCWRPPGARREAWSRFSLSEGRGPACPWLWDFCPLELRKNGFLLLPAPQFAVLLLEEPQKTNHLPSFSTPSPSYALRKGLTRPGHEFGQGDPNVHKSFIVKPKE